MLLAQQFSTCSACGQPIRPGDVIGRTFRGTVHAACEVVRPSIPSTSTSPVDMRPVLEFLGRATSRGLKRPAARFLGPDGKTELKISIASLNSRNPGAVYIVLGGEYLGKLTAQGIAYGVWIKRQDVLARLSACMADPAFEAKRYAVLMCRCSFCGLPLTDDGSVDAGYGPICARNYDLPHVALGTKKPVAPTKDGTL